jgi:hypothetical protein
MGHRMLCVLLLGTVFSFASEGKGQEAGPTKAQTGVPFDLVSDFLVVVKGGIGNLDDLKFIVDTGATWSVIDRKVAERLLLNRRPGRIMNFNRFNPDRVGGRHGTSRGTDSGPGSAGDGYEPGQIL